MSQETDLQERKQAVDPSPRKDGRSKIFNFLSTTPDVLSNVLSFLPTKDVVSLARISKSLLPISNGEQKKRTAENRYLNLGVGSEQELNECLAEIFREPIQTAASVLTAAPDSLPMRASSPIDSKMGTASSTIPPPVSALTNLHRILLAPGRERNSAQQRFFLQTRGAILAGKISVNEAVKQISTLSSLSTELFHHPSALAKIWTKSLLSWQQEALKNGYTWMDLCSDWMSRYHVISLSSEGAIVNMRNLDAHQIQGMTYGFAREHVLSAWYTPLHTEAIALRNGVSTLQFLIGRNSRSALALILELESELATTEEIRNCIKSPLGRAKFFLLARNNAHAMIQAILAEFSLEERALLITAPVSKLYETPGLDPELRTIAFNFIQEEDLDQESPLFVAARWGHAEAVEVMLTGFSLEERQRLITAPQKDGPAKGLSPFAVTAVKNQVATMEVMWAGSSLDQRASLITSLQGPGPMHGYSSLCAATSNGHRALVKTMLAGFSLIERRPLITSIQGSSFSFYPGRSPLFVAAQRGLTGIVKAMLKGYSLAERLILISTPLEGEGICSKYLGLSPLFIAATNNHAATVKTMLAGFSLKERTTAITAPQGGIHHRGISTLFMAAHRGHIRPIKVMLEGFPSAQQLTLITSTQQCSGERAGYSPLFVATKNNRLAVIEILLEELSPSERAAAITAPQGPGKAQGMSALFKAAAEGKTDIIKAMLAGFSSAERLRLLTSSQEPGILEGHSPLFIAAMENHAATVTAMLADLSLADRRTAITALQESGIKKGCSALYVAVERGHSATVEALLSGFSAAEREEQLKRIKDRQGIESGDVSTLEKLSSEKPSPLELTMTAGPATTGEQATQHRRDSKRPATFFFQGSPARSFSPASEISRPADSKGNELISDLIQEINTLLDSLKIIDQERYANFTELLENYAKNPSSSTVDLLLGLQDDIQAFLSPRVLQRD